jgi:hypothetical protein
VEETTKRRSLSNIDFSIKELKIEKKHFPSHEKRGHSQNGVDINQRMKNRESRITTNRYNIEF